MWKEKARSWRKNKKRAVSPIIATILLVAITVVLAAVLYILISGLTKGPGNSPISTAFSLGAPNEAQAGTNHWYNFTVESAGGGIIWNDINFQVKNSGGTIIAVTSYSVLTISGTTVATSTTGTTWTAGAAGSGATGVSSTQSVSLLSSASLSGDTLYVIGTGSFSGTEQVNIP